MSSSSRPSGGNTEAYPPAVYSGTASDGRHAVPPPGVLWWFVAIAAAGIPAGVLWWLCAPGGALFADAADASVWFPREATLAAIGVALGIATGLVVARRLAEGIGWRIIAAVAGSATASVLAWQLGQLLGKLGSGDAVRAMGESAAFVLRSDGILFLWPLTTAVIVLIRAALGRRRRAGTTAAAGDTRLES